MHDVDVAAAALVHLPAPTVGGVPWTDEGADRLAAELAHAHEQLDEPALVWLFDPADLVERRAVVYGWRDGSPRRALTVWVERGPVDRVAWICEPFLRPRSE